MNQHFLVDSQQIKEKSKQFKVSVKIPAYAKYRKQGSTYCISTDFWTISDETQNHVSKILMSMIW